MPLPRTTMKCDKPDLVPYGTASTSTSSSSSVTSASIASVLTPEESEEARLLAYHLSLLVPAAGSHRLQEVSTAPVFNAPVLKQAEALAASEPLPAFPQYGLLVGIVNVEPGDPECESQDPLRGLDIDPRIFFNVAAPSSTFICGSQGSGKSHTLSCLLENCLFPSDVGKLPRPLTGLVFHYDSFISDGGGSPCEATFLSSNPDIRVRVLCSPTNIRTIQRTYHSFANIEIEPLRISEANLNTKRMLDLMAVSRNDGPMPLYLHAVYRIIRQMRVEQQISGTSFSYIEFKKRIAQTEMTPAQLGPLTQRLETLESFMPNTQIAATTARSRRNQDGNDWTSKPGLLTIVDLSCPCVTPEGACSLFNICLSIFLEQDMATGRVVALDEAHKFMNESAEAQTLTSTLLSTIRLQRHLGARIFICTQEPTISPALLDLCSVTIVHRFTSPEWMHSLQAHLAAVVPDIPRQNSEMSGQRGAATQSRTSLEKEKKLTTNGIFKEIVELQVGEALLFSPSAVVGVSGNGSGYTRLGTDYLKVRVRSRLTTDGGRSVLAI